MFVKHTLYSLGALKRVDHVDCDTKQYVRTIKVYNHEGMLTGLLVIFDIDRVSSTLLYWLTYDDTNFECKPFYSHMSLWLTKDVTCLLLHCICVEFV